MFGKHSHDWHDRGRLVNLGAGSVRLKYGKH